MGGWLETLPGQWMKSSAQDTFLLPEQDQLNKYADAFYGLARLFQEMPCQKEYMGDEGLQEVFQEVQDEDHLYFTDQNQHHAI